MSNSTITVSMAPHQPQPPPAHKLFVGTVKLVVSAPSEEAARAAVLGTLNNARPVQAWGYLRLPDGQRAFLQPVEIDPAFFELRDHVRGENCAGPFANGRQEREAIERNDQWEAWFDLI